MPSSASRSHHLPDAIDPPAALLGEKRCRAPATSDVDEVAEHVDVGCRRATAVISMPGTNVDAGRARTRPRPRAAGRRVVVGDAQHRDAGAAARATSSAGVQRPSDAVVWV